MREVEYPVYAHPVPTLSPKPTLVDQLAMPCFALCVKRTFVSIVKLKFLTTTTFLAMDLTMETTSSQIGQLQSAMVGALESNENLFPTPSALDAFLLNKLTLTTWISLFKMFRVWLHRLFNLLSPWINSPTR